MSKVIYFNKPEILHCSQDILHFPFKCLCQKCKKINGKAKAFVHPRAKFYHLVQMHKLDQYDHPTLEYELKKLQSISTANQLGILNDIIESVESGDFLK